jgi:trehalose 6-phosphate synthase
MKKILLFILPILTIVVSVLMVLGLLQVRFEEEKLLDDLERKTRAVAEGMELSVRDILSARNLKNARYLVEKFQHRERRQGCVIYDKEGRIYAVTERFADWGEKERPYLQKVLSTLKPRGAVEQFKEYTLYSYVLPVVDEDNNAVGLIEIIHDTSYVFNRLTEIWKRINISLLVLAILITVAVSFLQRQIFILPLVRLTEWFDHFQKGDTDKLRPFTREDELGKLASEVEQVALSLRVARKAVTQKAEEKIRKEDLWTEAKLRSLVQAKVGESALVVVSNREPYMHITDKEAGRVECVRPASGVVTAIDPILRACGGTWIAHGSGDADKKFVNSKDKLGVPVQDNRYILKRVWLSKEEEAGYYYGFANEGLWPLCHITHTRPSFRETDWRMYKKVNQRFAQSVLEELPAKKPFVFLQDYHFTLLGRMIKKQRPDATVALFWHIPWPNPEVFSICPYYKEILDGMLGCDLIGFHVQYHCNNFLDTANRLLESRVDTERFSIVRGDKETFVRAFPISVDPRGADAAAMAVQTDKIRRDYDLGEKTVILSVERIDYTKGIVERLLAVDRFLEKYPGYKDTCVFIQIAAPSRTHIKRYHDLMGEIDELVEKINWKHSGGAHKPIIYLKRHFSTDEVTPFYALADVCVVSSLHDGMNLVAKEYVAAKTDYNGVLILSCFTGAARELTEAVAINPYSTEEFADSIKSAVDMPAEERRRRMAHMRKVVGENNVYRWAGAIMTELAALKKT